MLNQHIVFVYGSLTSKFWNHHILKDCNALSLGKGFTGGVLHSLGRIPGYRRSDNPRAVVTGELYLVDDVCLARLDRLEGYRQDAPETSMYNRIVTECVLIDHNTTETAFIYEYNGNIDDAAVVISGNWKEYYESNCI